jgi:hypothetical protein
MADISLVETDKIDEKIQRILRQTDYTEDTALEKLKEYGYDELATIRAYFGIPEKKTTQINSVNQEIYKQLRRRLDSNMREYHTRVENGEAKKIG